MENITYEIRLVGDLWQILRDGVPVCFSMEREKAIDMVAGLHRKELQREEILHLTLVGFELKELRNSRVLDINWRRKGPPIEIQFFEEAETFLQISAGDSTALTAFAEYEVAMGDEQFSDALDRLIFLGEHLQCSRQYWKIVYTIVNFVWSHWRNLPNRKQRGELETKVNFVERRAKGDQQWMPRLNIPKWDSITP